MGVMMTPQNRKRLNNKSRRNNKSHKRTLFDQSNKCHYCGKVLEYEEATVDHFIPRAKGGSNDIENKVLSCGPCNVKKGSMIVGLMIETKKDKHQ